MRTTPDLVGSTVELARPVVPDDPKRVRNVVYAFAGLAAEEDATQMSAMMSGRTTAG